MIPTGTGEAADGERLAPVTYLFGATAPTASPAPVEHAVATVAATPVASTLPDLSDLKQRIAEVESTPVEKASRREGKFDRISNVSMHALGRRGMSSREMTDYLLGREFEPSEVDEEVSRLERVGLLDDGELAETLVRTLRDRKGLGRSALTAELRRRNLDDGAVEAAMGAVGDDELVRATEIARKRAPQLRDLDDATAKRRLGAFLMRKGYSGSVVSAAVSSALTSPEPRRGPAFR